MKKKMKKKYSGFAFVGYDEMYNDYLNSLNELGDYDGSGMYNKREHLDVSYYDKYDWEYEIDIMDVKSKYCLTNPKHLHKVNFTKWEGSKKRVIRAGRWGKKNKTE